ncbi:unnamed protein product [Hapterophycus canaliculatus]
MGISLYFIFIGNTMLIASRTRKSNPANLALVGMTAVSSLAKCFLNKAIFEYMIKSARAKMQRKAAVTRMRDAYTTIKPMVHLVSSLRSIRESKAGNSKVVVDNSEESECQTDQNAVRRIGKSELSVEAQSPGR